MMQTSQISVMITYRRQPCIKTTHFSYGYRKTLRGGRERGSTTRGTKGQSIQFKHHLATIYQYPYQLRGCPCPCCWQGFSSVKLATGTSTCIPPDLSNTSHSIDDLHLALFIYSSIHNVAHRYTSSILMMRVRSSWTMSAEQTVRYYS